MPGGILSRTVMIGVCVMVLVALLPRALWANWASFRGDAQMTGVAAEALPEKPELLWALATADLEGDAAKRGFSSIESTAAIWEGTVFVGNLDGYLYAVDFETGEMRWRYDAGEEVKSSPAVADGVVYFGDELGVFHAVDAATGKARWTFAADGAISSSANLLGDRVLFGSYDNHLYCLNVGTGELAWRYETAGYVHASPAVLDSTVVTTGCDGMLRFIDVATGVESHNLTLGTYVASSCAIASGRGYVGTFGNEVLGIDLDEPRIEWNYAHDKYEFPFYSSAAVNEDFVVVGGRDKLVHALTPDTGEAVWTFATGGRVDSSPVIAGERVFFGSMKGVIHGLSLATGQEEWRFETGSAIVASPAVSDGRLVIGDDNGVLYCFGEPEKEDQ